MNVMQKVYISALLFLNAVVDNYSIVDSFRVFYGMRMDQFFSVLF